MREKLESQLKVEIEHIFESGANEIRILSMIKDFISKNYVEKYTTPQEVIQARNYIRTCESDMGFMGSPEYEYYIQKKIVDDYDLHL